MTSTGLWGGVVVGLALVVCSAAHAQTTSARTHEVTYTADVAGPVSGGAAHAGRALDNLDVILDGDLELLIG